MNGNNSKRTHTIYIIDCVYIKIKGVYCCVVCVCYVVECYARQCCCVCCVKCVKERVLDCVKV